MGTSHLGVTLGLSSWHRVEGKSDATWTDFERKCAEHDETLLWCGVWVVWAGQATRPGHNFNSRPETRTREAAGSRESRKTLEF